MIPITERMTIDQALSAAAARWPDRPFLCVPANPARGYDPQGRELSFAQVATAVAALAEVYRAAGYGLGHRVGLFLENRLEHVLHAFALASLGVCGVPVNPDYRPRELAYLIDHSRIDLMVRLPAHAPAVDAALAQASHLPPVVTISEAGGLPGALPAPRTRAAGHVPSPDTPASILYTSGTTGRPKGCVLSHRYQLAAGACYTGKGGRVSLRAGAERLYNPLPLFHVNAGVLSLFGMLLSGGCQVQTDRFQPSRWWSEVRESRATIVHYLGVVASMLMAQPPSAQDRDHGVRLGFGAGVEPQLHAAFEARFGFPLVELWGMTEIVRALSDHDEPRQVGTRAFGRAEPGLEARVVDDEDRDVPDGTPGELVVRHSAATPRKDFFSEYLDDAPATEAAWRGGWFHTGDAVTRDATGMLHFVDRRKNIIRRSGENIAAAEIEALLLSHPCVLQAAVLAVPDEVREEEPLACVVLRETAVPAPDGGPGSGDAAAREAHRAAVARELFDFCLAQLAYYKAPAWWWFTDALPTTGTQKIQKHQLFPGTADPRALAGMIDLRAFKKRGPR